MRFYFSGWKAENEVLPSRIVFLHGGFRMEDIDFFQVIAKVFPFVGTQDAKREADQCPEVNHRIVSTIVLTEFVNLGVAVMASGDAVIRPGRLDLLIFQPAVFQAFFFKPGLQEAAAAATAEVVGPVGMHVHEILFADHRFYNVTQVFCNGIAIAFTNNLAGILNGEFDFQVFVPVGINFEFAFADPFCIILIDIFYFKVMLKVEFFQSGPD